MSRLSKKDAHEAELAALGKLTQLASALGKARGLGSTAEIEIAQEAYDNHNSWCIEQFPSDPEIKRNCNSSNRNFSDTIKSLRVANDLLLWQVASLVGITKLYLERLEEGAALPPEEVVRGLAKALKADADELLQLCHEQHVSLAPIPTPEAEERRILGT